MENKIKLIIEGIILLIIVIFNLKIINWLTIIIPISVIVLYCSKYIAYRLYNKTIDPKNITKYKKLMSNGYKVVDRSELKPGDIIFLGSYNIVPLDLMILKILADSNAITVMDRGIEDVKFSASNNDVYNKDEHQGFILYKNSIINSYYAIIICKVL